MLCKVAIATLGCKVNHYESEGLRDALCRLGFTIVPFSVPADVCIVDTCTVTAKSDYQSRQLIRRMHRNNPSAPIVVTGCYAQISPSLLAEEPGVRCVVGAVAKHSIPDLIRNGLPSGTSLVVPDVSQRTHCYCPSVASYHGRTRAYLKIQDGCNSFCSYCIVPYARGRSRSVPEDDVVAHIIRLVAAGYQEVVLTGIHLGAYGHDLGTGNRLVALLKRIERDTALPRLRLSSIEPTELTDDIITFMKYSAILCRHLHIPLQSGDDAILHAMNRRYRAVDFRDRIEAVLASVPDAGIGIDIMAGFPGETDTSFDATCIFLESLPAAYFHVFPYSKRPGTAAASLAGPVPDRVKTKRAALLRAMGHSKRQAFSSRALGTSHSVLLEETRDNTTGLMRGFSGNYIPIVVTNVPRAWARRIIRVQVTNSRDGKTFGRMIDG